ncbi:LytR C-terminal domain-containing protein [Phytohabitans kaempferiae]|uniref:LytR C-terminal domain-containing protein n=1 Tax=Phytohabitans kaempferiae TaxID=1620943 RepID=A0ABV6MG54_9ACTN
MTFARVRALALVGLLLVAAAVVAVVVMVRDSQRGDAGPAACPEGAVVVDLALRHQREITVAVLGGTGAERVAASVAADFRNCGFQVDEPRDEPRPERVEGIAVLRYGPDGVGAAHVVRAYFLGKATLDFDAGRTGAQVDVLVGERFRALAQPTDVNIALADLGRPALPPGTCRRA